MRFLMRFVVVLLMIYAGLSFVRRLFGQSLPSRRPERPSEPSASGRLVKDPVCGMYIPQATAIQARDQFFCSESCRQKFLEA